MEQAIYFLYAVTLLISGVMALVYRKALQQKGLFILTLFIPYVILQETILYLMMSARPNVSTAFVYNIYRPLSVIVFAILYACLPCMKRWKKWITWLTAFYLLLAATDLLFLESVHITSSYLSLLRGFLITLFAVFFLFSYFNLDNRTAEKNWQPVLWVTIGVITFYPVISLSLAFQRFLSASDSTLYGLKVYQVIPQFMSIFMYSCFSYAFYLCQKKT